MASGWRQGRYTLRNPKKYKGDPNNIIYRSSWELKANEFLDGNPNILEWGSETIAIPYVKPTTGRVHHYYPDYYVMYKNRQGQVIKELWEVKPETQTRQPKRRGKPKRYQINEAITWEVNKAKWAAATQFCNKYGLKFKIITERDMFK